MREQEKKDSDKQIERILLAAHRELSSSINQRKIYQDKVCESAARHSDSFFRLLCQLASIHQGTLQTIP